MNLFEDLVEELKEDNLLEVTIIDSVQVNESDQFLHSDLSVQESKESNAEEVSADAFNAEDPDYSQVNKNEADKLTDSQPSDLEVITENKSADIKETANDLIISTKVNNEYVEVDKSTMLNDSIAKSDLETAPAFDEPIVDAVQINSSEVIEESVVDENNEIINFASNSELNEEQLEEKKVEEVSNGLVNAKPSEEPFVKEEFYRRRALDQVIGLEMVEHVISGVEREQMKLVSERYDEVDVKKALHEFLKVADDVKSPEHSSLEFKLLQESENWTVELSKRDCNISVGHLRRYSETTKPSLSSQALISLARFYRNAPFTEDVRAKFDLVVTSLFTEDIANEKRSLAFKPKELSKHIQELYADWSSVPLYATEEEDSQLLLSALKYEDFIQEVENAESFDALIKKDFFRRLKAFKEKTSENFFAPILVSAAIKCNVVVGNRYVELLEEAQEAGKNLGDKYGEVHDKSISDATSKTVNLINTLREKGAIKETVQKKENSKKQTIIKLVLEMNKK